MSGKKNLHRVPFRGTVEYEGFVHFVIPAFLFFYFYSKVYIITFKIFFANASLTYGYTKKNSFYEKRTWQHSTLSQGRPYLPDYSTKPCGLHTHFFLCPMPKSLFNSCFYGCFE